MTTSPIDAYLARLHQEWLPESSGAVADYIPPLALADPDSFGIAVATTEGHCYEVGDSRVGFTIQSMSKPFTYGLALADRGFEAVDAKVGGEPSGEAFNSISLAPGSGRPLNPMINAGAITSTSLVAGGSAAAREGRVVDFYGRFAGRALEVDTEVYESERDTGHRNRAIGHMLRAFGVLEADPEEALDLYFRQCSVNVDCRDLSLMAATLANGGVNPLTGDRVLARALVDRVLSVMTTCGMYDSAGEWVVDVGMPAKSGVGGGVLAVLPGQLGIAVFSPPLDPHGNSVRGVEVCRQISTDLNLNLLHVARSSRSAVRRTYTVAEVPSRRRRPEAESAVLAAAGSRCMVQILHGDLVFAAMESVVRGIVERSAGIDVEVLDLTEVTEIDLGAGRLLVGLAESMAAEGKALAIVASSQGDLLEGLDAERLEVFPDLDRATEWCEDRLLAAHGPPPASAPRITLAEHRLARGFDPAQLAALAAAMAPLPFEAGEPIFAAGDPADAAYLLLEGEVTLELEIDGTRRRLATMTPGFSFGEFAFADASARPVSVRAETAGECLVLTLAAFEEIGERNPALQAALLRNLLAGYYEIIGRATREVGSLLGGR
ncbi:MAG: glutaminase A [Solirubrobacterales bacterium 70-9]|nr:MAG: glutaminase A [Solirubrobacterales bacterium 70-9]